MESWSQVIEPGSTPPVDSYPFLKLIPERLLGMWRSRASKVGDQMNSLYSDILDKVLERRENGRIMDSFLDKLLNQNEKLGYSQHQLYFLAGVLLEGGSDTSASTILAFIQAMTKWPAVQKIAQKEIDDVVGRDRSPVWADYNKLPYVAAVIKETMRWRGPSPLGFPHALAKGKCSSCTLW